MIPWEIASRNLVRNSSDKRFKTNSRRIKEKGINIPMTMSIKEQIVFTKPQYRATAFDSMIFRLSHIVKL
jgi:hypothetical protein